MGGPKALVRDPAGTAWVERTTRTVASGGCDPVLVVVGAGSAEVMAELAGLPVEVVEAPDWQEGMGASLRAGLMAVAQYSNAVGALVVPVDVPGLTASVVRRIAAGADRGALVRAVYHDSPGHPVFIGRDHWSGVVGMAVGDQGARAYLTRHPPREVECADLADGADVDTADQLPAGHRAAGLSG
jgi:nicotine blue oxidoreductase